MQRRAIAVVVVMSVSALLGACAGTEAVRRPDALQAAAWRFVPPQANAIAWVDMAGFRQSSLQDLVDNDVQAVQALMDEVGPAAGASSTTQALMPRLLDTWRKLDGMLVAAHLRPAAATPPLGAETIPSPAPPAPATEDDAVMVFFARWTDADIDAIARLSNTPATPSPAPASQPALMEPPPPAPPAPPFTPATPPPGANPCAAPTLPPGDTPPVDMTPEPFTMPAAPPPEPMVRAVIAGKNGWTWGTSTLVPVGDGVWVLGERPFIERILGQPERSPALDHPELAAMMRDLRMFEQTFAYVGREDSVVQAEGLLPSTGLSETAPWPKVIEPGDWFGLGMDAHADIRLALVVVPSNPSHVNAAETRMRAWRDRFAASGFARFAYLHEAFAEARVQAVHDRVTLEAVVGEERAALAYARISGMAMVVGAIVLIVMSALGSFASGMSALGGS